MGLVGMDDFRPTASWENLRLRADLLRKTREFFHRHGLFEVETPLLSADTVVDRHLDPFQVTVESSGRKLWLQTSPEFCMKRLLADGAQAIYQITRAFRQDELGPLHNPEFTIVEWYRVGDGPDEAMRLLAELCQTLLDRGPVGRISYAEAFERHVGLNPHTADTQMLVRAVEQHAIQRPPSLSLDDRDGWLDLLLVELVEPHLGQTAPVIVYDYPASQAALARIRPDEPPVAERFELYVAGIELANGYHELVDPAELERRNAESNQKRLADGKPPLPEQSRLLAAMQSGLPSAAGVALGFDRLVMLAAGASRLDAVIAFPQDRA